METLFLRIGGVAYNVSTIRTIEPSSKQSEAVIQVGQNRKTGAPVYVFVDDAIVDRLLKELATRNMLIDLSTP